jgi:transcription elongation factor Elf1
MNLLNELTLFNKEDIKYEIIMNEIQNNLSIYKTKCCICGLSYEKHINSTHRYINIQKEYKCMNCNRYFYEHKHNKENCYFKPYKYIN